MVTSWSRLGAILCVFYATSMRYGNDAARLKVVATNLTRYRDNDASDPTQVTHSSRPVKSFRRVVPVAPTERSVTHVYKGRMRDYRRECKQRMFLLRPCCDFRTSAEVDGDGHGKPRLKAPEKDETKRKSEIRTIPSGGFFVGVPRRTGGIMC